MSSCRCAMRPSNRQLVTATTSGNRTILCVLHLASQWLLEKTLHHVAWLHTGIRSNMYTHTRARARTRTHTHTHTHGYSRSRTLNSSEFADLPEESRLQAACNIESLACVLEKRPARLNETERRMQHQVIEPFSVHTPVASAWLLEENNVILPPRDATIQQKACDSHDIR